MSLDQRLRDGLRELGVGMEPDVEEGLRFVLRKGRRNRTLRRATQVAAAAAAAAVLVFTVTAVVDLTRRTAQPARPVPAPLQRISGTYQTVVPARAGVIVQRHLAGNWTLELASNGVLSVTPPAAFPYIRSGHSFAVTSTTFRTDLFINDLCAGVSAGTYSWRLSDGRLNFTPVVDKCPARMTLLTSSWTSTSR